MHYALLFLQSLIYAFIVNKRFDMCIFQKRNILKSSVRKVKKFGNTIIKKQLHLGSMCWVFYIFSLLTKLPHCVPIFYTNFKLITSIYIIRLKTL